MEIKEYVELNYPNKKQTHYNIKSQLNEYFNFIKVKPEKYVNMDRDFKKDIQLYNSHLLNTPRPRTGKPYAPITVNIHISAIRGYLEEHDILLSPRFYKNIIKRGNGSDTILEDRIPTREEIEKLLIHGDARDKAFFLTMLSSGMREEELCGITITNINFDSNPVIIKIPANISKTKKKRFTFISVEAKYALQEWLKIRESYIKQKHAKTRGLYEYLDKTYNKKVNDINGEKVFPYRPLSARTWWNRLLNKAGFTEKDENTQYYKLHLYTLRKYFNTIMKTHCNIIMVEMWAGHKVNYDYEKWTEEQHKQEYLKAVDKLLIYKTPSNVEELEKLKTNLKQEKTKVREVENIKQEMEDQRKLYEHEISELHRQLGNVTTLVDKLIEKG